jgi:hypothetical protein
LLVKVPQDIGLVTFRHPESPPPQLDTPDTPDYNLPFLTPAAAANAAGQPMDRGA